MKDTCEHIEQTAERGGSSKRDVWQSKNRFSKKGTV
jgi:hypothetical protein